MHVLWAIAAFAQEPEPTPPGFVVLLRAVYTDEARATAAISRTFELGVPRHAEYPVVVPYATWEREGYGLAIAAPRARAVADRLARGLEARGVGVEVLPSNGLPTEDLRVFAVDELRVTGNGALLFPYAVCLTAKGAAGGDCWAEATLDLERGFVVPFTAAPEGSLGVLRVEAGKPWSCPDEILGAPPAAHVWLRAPTDVACFEDSRKAKRKATR